MWVGAYRSLLQQLLGNIKHHRRRKVSRKASHRLSSCGRSPTDSINCCAPTATAAEPARMQHSSGGGSLPASVASVHQQQEQQKCRADTKASDAAAITEGGDWDFTDGDIARFQAGLRKCLNGVTQIKVGNCSEISRLGGPSVPVQRSRMRSWVGPPADTCKLARPNFHRCIAQQPSVPSSCMLMEP